MGVVYFICAAALSLRDHPDTYALIAIIFGGSLISYTIKQEVSMKFGGLGIQHAACGRARCCPDFRRTLVRRIQRAGFPLER